MNLPLLAFDAEFVKAINQLVQTLGPGRSLLCGAALVVVGACYRLYQDYKKSKDTNVALAEKERSLQRMADESRMWRIIYLKQQGWHQSDIAALIIDASVPDTPLLSPPADCPDCPNPPPPPATHCPDCPRFKAPVLGAT